MFVYPPIFPIMKEIIKVKEKYSLILENYQRDNSALNYNYRPILKFCHLCRGTVKFDDYEGHMQAHEIKPPVNLTYQLTLPFRFINGKIRRGTKFIKLLVLYSKDEAFSVPYNGLNLVDWTKLTDTEEVTIRWSTKKKQFVRTLW